MHTHRSRAAVIGLGLLSLIGILTVLVALPAALWTFGGNPLPEHLPSIAEATARLSSPDDGALFLGILKLLGWAGWATFALSLLVQIPAQLRGLPAPRLPGLSWQQGRSAVMVGAVAAMFTLIAAGGLASAPTAQAAPAASSTTLTTGTPAPAAMPETAPTLDSPAPTAAQFEVVTVESGDTLWGIAEAELGDGARYPEIVDATASTIQPDGQQLHDPDLIYPGWQVTVPAAAAANPAPAPAPAIPAPPATGGSSTDVASDTTPQTPGDSIPSRPDLGGAGSLASSGTASTTPTASSSAPTPAPAPSAAVKETAGTADSGYLPAVLTAAGLGSLAAAGLLGALKRRRDKQSRRRQPGRRIALPAGTAALAEAQLRVAADPLAASDLNRALRTLAAHARRLEAPMPALRAARITHDTLELYLVDADVELPEPFTTSVGDPGTWTLHRGDLSVLLDDDAAAEIPAPYPSLVTVGHDEQQAHLLLNLEELGALALTGDPQLAHEVLTALAIELITSTWTDDSRITLVGVLPELVAALASDRTTYVETLEQIITALEYTATVHRDALAEQGQAGATQARAAGLVEDTWTPHLILVGTDLTATDRERITHLLTQVPRVALATITTRGPAVGEWSLRISRDGDHVWADLSPIPVRVTPQRLPAADYQAALDLFAVTDEEDITGPEWTEGIAAGDALTIADLPQPDPLEADDIIDDAAAPAPTVAVADDETTPETTDVDEEEDLVAAPRLVTAVDDESDVDDQGERVATEPATVESSSDEDTGDVELVDDPNLDRMPSLHPDLPVLRVLGPVAVEGTRGKRPESHRRILEVITYLALCPGQSPAAFNEAIFPGERITGQKRNTYMSYARAWLGDADDGHPFVGIVADSGYALAPDAQLDWTLFQDLIGPSIGAASTDRLKAALELVTGEPLSGVDASKYEWAQSVKSEIIAAVADVAHEVARRATMAGDPRTAAWAATKGLAAEPINEALWRDAITAAWQSGIPGRARDLISRCHTAIEDLGDLEDETITLINDIIKGERKRAYA